LGNVFVQRALDTEVEVVVAKRAWQSESGDDNVKMLTFADGRRYKGEPGNPVFEIVYFKEHGIPYALPASEPIKLKPESRPLADLLGGGDPELTAELQWRLSVPLTTMVLTIIAVPLSRSQPRQGRYGGLAAGVLVFIIYVDLLAAAKIWVEREDVPPFIGVWWVHLLFLAVGGILLGRQFGYFNRLKLRRS
jgi:lipopolysaccharide export system permease protein